LRAVAADQQRDHRLHRTRSQQEGFVGGHVLAVERDDLAGERDGIADARIADVGATYKASKPSDSTLRASSCHALASEVASACAPKRIEGVDTASKVMTGPDGHGNCRMGRGFSVSAVVGRRRCPWGECGRILRGVSAETRRETAELYAEMFDHGYNPSRGLGPALAIMVVFAVVFFVAVLEFVHVVPMSLRDIFDVTWLLW
jgi:hypothetical protein